jgi:phosphate transport system substrate-binding protein
MFARNPKKMGGFLMVTILRTASVAMLALPLSLSTAYAGELPVVGTGDGIELLKVLGAAYSADHPQTIVLVPPSIHSSGGIAAVGSDKEVLGRIARPLKDAEKASGIMSVPVFRLPAAIYIHPAAGVSNLTAKQLTAIYTGEVTNWKEVGGEDLRIKVVRREEVDSTLNVLRDTMPGWSVPGAIGFGPYTKELERSLTVVKIDGKFPTDQDYPSAVTLSLIYKNNTVTPEAKGFINFFKTGKAKTLLTSLGGVPIE